MKAGDVLADEMEVRRPPLPKQFFVAAVTDSGDVVQDRIEPDIDCERFIKRNANAPVLTGAAYIDVLQAALHQAQYFIPPAFRLDKAGMLIVVIEQLVLE